MLLRLAPAVLCLLLGSGVARAERAVILEFSGDRGGRLRHQVEQAVRASKKVEVVSLKRYLRAAARKRVSLRQVMGPSGVAALAPELKLDVAVSGAVQRTFAVQILDSDGAELWSKRLPLIRGRLSPVNLRRLAVAIAAAAKAKAPAAPAPTPVPEKPEEPAPAPPPPPHEAPPPPAPERPPAVAETPKPPVPASTRRFLTLALTGTSTWRSYCSRPGVTSCHAYDALPDAAKPPGESVNFTSDFPYTGGDLWILLFPFSSQDSLLRGLGVSASYGRAYSLTKVRITTPSATTPDVSVTSVDQSLTAEIHGRYDFNAGAFPGFAELRLGGGYRGFAVDPKAGVPLPGASRWFPSIGVGVGIAFLPWLGLDVAGLYLIGPGPGVSEVQAYGSPARATGLAAEVGLSGDVIGPFGYVLRLRYERFADSFLGAGQRWTSGGAAEESFAVFHWGVSAHF